MKKPKFKLEFHIQTKNGNHVTLNAQNFTSLRSLLPTDVDVVRRVLMFKSQQLEIEPYSLQLKEEKWEEFQKELKMKVPNSMSKDRKDMPQEIYLGKILIVFIEKETKTEDVHV